jgi:hypothetical protein
MLSHAPTSVHLSHTHVDVQMLVSQYTHGCHVAYSSVRKHFQPTLYLKKQSIVVVWCGHISVLDMVKVFMVVVEKC